MSTDEASLANIPGLIRVENTSREDLLTHCLELAESIGPRPATADRYCTVEEYIDCPPQAVYDYLRKGHHLEEWTYSVRDFVPAGRPKLWQGYDRLADETLIYCEVVANPEAMTVDYHCAWDQGDTLWMIYLMRVVPAQLVLGTTGSVVTWTNCRHPFYQQNPFPTLAARDRPWVGDYWDVFYAGHLVEMRNLKTILEFRHHHQLPVSVPPVSVVRS